MKRKIFVSMLLVVMIVVTATMVMVGCNNDTTDYTVTVVNDGKPVSGITVNWNASGKVQGSATTGENGKATAYLKPATYEISLFGYTDGLSYTKASVNATMRNVTFELTVEQVEYSATVIDKNGNPVQNATVTWTQNNAIKGTATTDANGKATKVLDYGEYIVLASNLPDGNLTNGNLKATPTNPSVEFRLVNGVAQKYNVTYRTEGGLKLKGATLIVFDGNDITATSGNTDEDGVFTFALAPGKYTVEPLTVDNGYTYTPLSLSETVFAGDLVIKSEVISTPAPDSTRYVIGDIIHDYTFTTPYNKKGTTSPITVKISELLKTKKAIIINNWGTNCTWCMQEMPDMAEAYEKYKDKIEIIAVSNYPSGGFIGDSDATISNVYEETGYEFPMMRDSNNLRIKFGVTSYPTTIVIDRYGAIARIEIGAVLGSEVWERLINKYIGDDYVQDYVPGASESDSINNEIAKPDITVPKDHYTKLAQAINKFTADENYYINYYGSTYENAWPFLFGAVDGVSTNGEALLYTSNGRYGEIAGKANSISILQANVKIPAGKVLTFDYYCSTESDDILSIVWDGKIIKELSGVVNEWKTCYLYTDLTNDEHSLAFSFIKDVSGNGGKDNIFIKNIRFLDIADIAEPTDMLRSAAYGTPAEGANKFPKYATVALNPDDGYYHVTTSALENSEFAGTDESPLLFINMLGVTNLHSSLNLLQMFTGILAETNNYAFNCTFELDGETKDWREELVEYLQLATISDIYGYIPVNQRLHDLLVGFLKTNFTTFHEDEWLETCYFYSHYGNDGKFVGNPLIGLTDDTALTLEATDDEVKSANGKKVTAELTRNINPFPFVIYTFTVPSDGVYEIRSLIPSKDSQRYSGQIWIYDEKTDADNPLIYCGDTHYTLKGDNDHNFEVYRYMKAGEKYYFCVAYQMQERGSLEFTIKNIGPSTTVLIPCSDNVYNGILNSKGELVDTVLAGAVEYVKKDDGYYYAKNPDGSLSPIYLNVGYDANAVFAKAIKDLINDDMLNPVDRKTSLGYKVFDFRYRIAYETDGDNGTVLANGKLNLSDPAVSGDNASKYKDYTDIIKGYVDGDTDGDGLILVNQELVDFLTLYLETRNNMLLNNKYEFVKENEWLRFCWYERTYDENNL